MAESRETSNDTPHHAAPLGVAHEIFWSRWGLGVALAAALAVYGIVCMVTRRGTLPGKGSSVNLTGSDAIALGIACLAGAVVMHCHGYWESYYEAHRRITLIKAAALLAFIAAAAYLLVRVLLYL